MPAENRAVWIVRGGVTFAAIICPHCGGKVWPATALEGHLDRHEMRRLLIASQLLPLQRTLKRLRLVNKTWG